MEHPSRVGKYELEQFLGGGMSHVYRAKDTVLGRLVALKILTEAGSADAEAKARFLLEARMASSISHENIISVYDFGEEHGRPYIVMEFLEGESLRDAIRNAHLGDFYARMRIALQVARALDFIHARKIIHRDIKPENIHVDKNAKVKLMDFGIAKSEGVQLTRAGFTLGTPFYMAPEQVLGKPLTPQADVYAWGILLYEVLTGTKPVAGDSIEKIFQSILYEPVNLEPLKALGMPPWVVELIRTTTAKQAADRPESLGIVCGQIERMIDSGSQKPARPPASAPQQHAPPQRPTPQPTTQKPAAPSTGPPVQTRPQQVTPRPAASAGTRNATPALPGFLAKLPSPLRSQGGLMFLAALSVLVAVLGIAGVLWMLKLI